MRDRLAVSILFFSIARIVSSDDNIYGPGGVNLGPNGNPIVSPTNSHPPQSISPEQSQADPGTGFRNDDRIQSLEWEETRFSNSGNAAEDEALQKREAVKAMRRSREAIFGPSTSQHEETYNESSNQPAPVTINIRSLPNNTHSTPNLGAINSSTGEFYTPAGKGYIGTKDGRYYAPAGPNGVVDTRTGQFITTHK